MKTKKTILVTGSSGFIGSPLVKKLLNSEVYILGLDPSAVPEIGPENLMEQEIAKKLLQKSSSLFK